MTETSGTCPGHLQRCTVCSICKRLQRGSALLHQCLCRLGSAVAIADSILATHKSTCISVWLLSPHVSLNSIQLELQAKILCIPFHCSKHRTLSRAHEKTKEAGSGQKWPVKFCRLSDLARSTEPWKGSHPHTDSLGLAVKNSCPLPTGLSRAFIQV